MTNIVPFKTDLPAERRIKGEMARHMDRMQIIAETTKAALDEVSDIHAYSVYKATTTLVSGEIIKRAAGELPPDQKAALQILDQQYLQTVGQLSGLANVNIARSVQKAAADNRNGMEKLADWLDGQ